MRKIFATLLITLLIPTSIFAQQNVSDVIGNQEEEDTTATVTEETVEAEGDIELKLPTQTDNPSYIITFIDPSEEEEGVQLEIDGDRFVEIESPYTLPALGIGDHVLKFKYTDDEGAVQTLERELIVIPRAPILNSPVINDSSVTISGTGLANAEILLTISTGAKTYQYDIDIPDNGSWSYSFTEGDSEEIYSVQAITRKYGYASNFSEVLTFELGDIETISTEEETPISFGFKQIDSTFFKSLTSTNLDFLIFAVSTMVLGILLGVVGNTLIRNRIENKSLGTFREKINGGKKEKEEVTLRELFEKENGGKGKNKKDTKKKVDEKEKKEEDNKKDTKETKVVSKNEFLEVYKDYDPDDEKGKEKKKKKKFKISLTSKKN